MLDLGTLQAHLRLDGVDKFNDDLKKAEDLAIEELAKEVRVEGFRKGKVPMEVAKKFINAQNVFTHGTSNPLVKIPLVVIYIDSRTSQVSRDFIDSVLTKE